MNSTKVQNPRPKDVAALCACSKKLIIGLGHATSAVVVSIELERRRFSENAAYIRALEPLKPLVSLV